MSNIFCKIGYLPLAKITFPVIDKEKAQLFFQQLGWVNVFNDCIREPCMLMQLELLRTSEKSVCIQLKFLSKKPEQAAKEIIEWVKSQNWKYKILYTLTGVEIELPEVFCSSVLIEKDLEI